MMISVDKGNQDLETVKIRFVVLTKKEQIVQLRLKLFEKIFTLWNILTFVARKRLECVAQILQATGKCKYEI